MSNTMLFVAAIVGLMVVLPGGAFSQEATAPVYKDGEWWRVKKESIDTRGGTSSECQNVYAEWLVKREAGQFKTLGIKETREEAIDCPSILREVFGMSSESPGYLKFPLKVGLTWSERYYLSRFRSWRSVEHEVKSFEKVSTPKGEFEAFKIVRTAPGQRLPNTQIVFDTVYTYYYSPKIKSFVLFKSESGQFSRLTTILVDFSVME